jgi:hypothetical protein
MKKQNTIMSMSIIMNTSIGQDPEGGHSTGDHIRMLIIWTLMSMTIMTMSMTTIMMAMSITQALMQMVAIYPKVPLEVTRTVTTFLTGQVME